MRTVLFNLAQAFGIILLADFVAGIVHWLEDAYGTENTPIVGPRLIRPNIVHHHFPRFFTRLSWWQSSGDLLCAGALLIAAGWWWGFLSWQLWLFVAISVNANQVHKWAHRTRAENGPFISFLQDIRFLQTPRHHALHHTDPKNTFYCPITDFVNPALERIQFWPRLEWLIARVTGIEHRHDTSNRGQGPGPEWLSDYRPRPATPRSTCDCSACPGTCTRRLAGRSDKTRDTAHGRRLMPIP
jgi:plasmanylethanolamine desaturase